eukprot:6760632-Prymnesium_polylepis.1
MRALSGRARVYAEWHRVLFASLLKKTLPRRVRRERINATKFSASPPRCQDLAPHSHPVLPCAKASTSNGWRRASRSWSSC